MNDIIKNYELRKKDVTFEILFNLRTACSIIQNVQFMSVKIKERANGRDCKKRN